MTDPATSRLDAPAPILDVRSVSLTLGSTRALDGADLSVHAGESVAVIGPSGSGKSSLLHCAAGVLRPDAGEVHLGSRRIDDLADHELSAIRRDSFGFVFQFSELLPELDLLENVGLPRRLAGARRRAADEAALDLLDALGIADLAARYPYEVSGGQLQRAAIARSLVNDPAIVFADEPTGALDSATSGSVLEVLVDRSVRRSASLVLVTHDPAVAERADRIVAIVDGRTSDRHAAQPEPAGLEHQRT